MACEVVNQFDLSVAEFVKIYRELLRQVYPTTQIDALVDQRILGQALKDWLKAGYNDTFTEFLLFYHATIFDEERNPVVTDDCKIVYF